MSETIINQINDLKNQNLILQMEYKIDLRFNNIEFIITPKNEYFDWSIPSYLIKSFNILNESIDLNKNFFLLLKQLINKEIEFFLKDGTNLTGKVNRINIQGYVKNLLLKQSYDLMNIKELGE